MQSELFNMKILVLRAVVRQNTQYLILQLLSLIDREIFCVNILQQPLQQSDLIRVTHLFVAEQK